MIQSCPFLHFIFLFSWHLRTRDHKLSYVSYRMALDTSPFGSTAVATARHSEFWFTSYIKRASWDFEWDIGVRERIYPFPRGSSDSNGISRLLVGGPLGSGRVMGGPVRTRGIYQRSNINIP